MTALWSTMEVSHDKFERGTEERDLGFGVREEKQGLNLNLKKKKN